MLTQPHIAPSGDISQLSIAVLVSLIAPIRSWVAKMNTLLPQSSETTAFRIELLKALVAAGETSYKESTRVTSVIDDKAQKTSGLAGIFLAAAFAALRPDTIAQLHMAALILLSIAVSLLLLSSGLGLGVLWVRTNAPPLSVSDLDSMILDFFNLPLEEVTSERKEALYFDHGNIWSARVSVQAGINDKKAQLLKYSQFALAASMGCVGLFLIYALVLKFR